jgi:hypothetical protein
MMFPLSDLVRRIDWQYVSVISSIGTRKEMQKMDKKKNTAEKKV